MFHRAGLLLCGSSSPPPGRGHRQESSTTGSVDRGAGTGGRDPSRARPSLVRRKLRHGAAVRRKLRDAASASATPTSGPCSVLVATTASHLRIHALLRAVLLCRGHGRLVGSALIQAVNIRKERERRDPQKLKIIYETVSNYTP